MLNKFSFILTKSVQNTLISDVAIRVLPKLKQRLMEVSCEWWAGSTSQSIVLPVADVGQLPEEPTAAACGSTKPSALGNQANRSFSPAEA